MDLLSRIPSQHRPDCARCPFGANALPPDVHNVVKGVVEHGQPRHRPVLGILRSKCKGVLVGESPGADEVSQEEVFIGSTGKWLKLRLLEAGLSFDDFTVINSIGCQPGKGLKTDSNMGHARTACKPLFDWQMQGYQHKPKLAMGKWAGAAVNRGSPISVDTGRGFLRSWGILTWHPTYAAFYNPWKVGEFTNDVQRFARLLSGKLEPAPTTLIRPTVADIVRLVKSSNKVLACDIETRAPHGKPAHWGKDPTRADLRTIALGTPSLGMAYWWGSDFQVQQTIIRVLQDPKILKVFHNGYFFDLRVLKRYNINTQNIMDTRDMRRAVSATSRLSLRFLASVYSDFAPWKEDEK